jgi:hypothetical protein
MIYRTQLNDCKKALSEFEAVIVFGQGGLLNEQARLGRAACALELGDLDTAAREISILEARSAHLSLRSELSELKDRLVRKIAEKKPIR